MLKPSKQIEEIMEYYHNKIMWSENLQQIVNLERTQIIMMIVRLAEILDELVPKK